MAVRAAIIQEQRNLATEEI